MNSNQINILPCSGIGKALGTLSRWTAFEITEKVSPKSTNLLCLARLVAGDDESQEKLHKNFNITLDGCPKKCALKNVEKNGATVEKSYLMAKFLIRNKDLKIDAKNIIDPGPDAQELARRISAELSVVIDTLLLHGDENSNV